MTQHDVHDHENTRGVPTQVPPAAPPSRDACWRRYLAFVRRLDRHGELAAFVAELHDDRHEVEDVRLMHAAIELVRDPTASTVKHPPTPSVEQLTDLAGWLAQVVTDNDTAQRRKRWGRELRVAGPRDGQITGASSGPVYQQQSKHGLDELVQRLESVIAKHQAAGREFKREMLDHRSPHYVTHRDGGIDTKGIVFLANFITGQAERRSYDENWAIVSEFLNGRKATGATVKPTRATRRSRP